MFSGHYAFPNDYANAQRSLLQIHRYYTCNLVYRALCFVYLEIKKQNKYNLSSVQKSLNRNWQLIAWRDFPEFLKMETEFIKSILLIRFKFRSWAKPKLVKSQLAKSWKVWFPRFSQPMKRKYVIIKNVLLTCGQVDIVIGSGFWWKSAKLASQHIRFQFWSEAKLCRIVAGSKRKVINLRIHVKFV